jgi:uncharacterized RDD family membrane protein YckC
LRKCPFCASEIEEENRFCLYCGKEQPEKTDPKVCPKCSRGITQGDAFCTSCGTRVVSGKEPVAPAQVPAPTSQPERTAEKARRQPQQTPEAQPAAPAVPREACAGVGQRFVALIFDTMIIIFLMNLLISLGVDLVYSMDIDVVSKLGIEPWLKELPQEDFSFVEMKDMANLLFLSIISNSALIFTYYFIFEAAVGAPPGKLITGLRVLKKDGGKCTIGAVAVRNLLRFVDALPFLYLLGALFVSFTPYKQRLGDLAAGTVVANKRLLK